VEERRRTNSATEEVTFPYSASVKRRDKKAGTEIAGSILLDDVVDTGH